MGSSELSNIPILSKSLEMIDSKPLSFTFFGILILLIGICVIVTENYEHDALAKKFIVFASSQQYDDSSDQMNQGNEISKKYFEESTDFTNPANSSDPDEVKTGQDSLSQLGNKLEIYQNQDFGFKIAYPFSWQEAENIGSDIANVIFVSPLESNDDKFNERLAVRVSHVHSSTTLGTFSDTYISNIRNNPNSEVISTTESTISGSPAEKLIYTLRQGEKQFGILEQWTIKNSKVYQISFYGELEKYQTYLPNVEELINSFEIYQ